MSTGSSPSGPSPQAYLGVGTFFVALTGVVLVVRLGASYKHHRQLLVEDYVALSAVITLVATFAMTYRTVIALTSLSPDVVALSRMAQATNFLASYSMWSSKIPILLCYIRLFGVKKWLKAASYFIIYLTAMAFIAGTIVTAVACYSHNRTLDAAYFAHCTSQASKMGVYLGVIAVASDLGILVIPFPVLARLQISFRRKIGLTILFLTGIFAIAASVVALWSKILAISGRSTDLTTAMFCTTIECSIAIMVGSAPTLFSFWTGTVVQSELYSRLRTSISNISPARSIRSKSTSSSYSGGQNGNATHEKQKTSGGFSSDGERSQEKSEDDINDRHMQDSLP